MHTLVTPVSRWTAVYKVIPDEQPVIQQTLEDMVRFTSGLSCFNVHSSNCF